MERFSYHCDALFGAIGARCDSETLVKFGPAIKELLLVWNLRYARLRYFERRLGSGKAICPEFYELLDADLVRRPLHRLPLQNQQ